MIFETIKCRASVGLETVEVISCWEYNPGDPWVFKMTFFDQEAKWVISLDLVKQALTDPSETIQGYADIKVETSGFDLFIHLDNGESAATLKFRASEVRDFLNQIDSSSSDETMSEKLDEFLGTL